MKQHLQERVRNAIQNYSSFSAPKIDASSSSLGRMPRAKLKQRCGRADAVITSSHEPYLANKYSGVGPSSLLYFCKFLSLNFLFFASVSYLLMRSAFRLCTL